MIPAGFHRVTKRERCPICGHADWCLVSDDDGARAICPRTPSDRRFSEESGWLHTVGAAVRSRRVDCYVPETAESTIDVTAILKRYWFDTTTARLAHLADEIGVSRESLKRLGACWAANHDAWAFPMYDGQRRPIGIRLRALDGGKFAVRGSKSGLFIPKDQELIAAAMLVVCEGPTDAGALLDLGFNVIGRPSCSGGTEHLLTMIRGAKVDVVIFADRDGSGLAGAEAMAARLSRPTKIVAPPRHKDARAWVNAGASRSAVELVIRNAKYVSRRSSA